MKNKKIKAFTLATLVGSSSLIYGSPLVLQANSIDKEDNKLHMNRQVAQGKEIYVKTFEGAGGDGSLDKPYNRFSDAYDNAKDGDTIVLLNTVTIQNNGNNSTDKPFLINKKLTFKGVNDQGTLYSRVPIQLGNDVIFDNIGFTSSKVYLNGYSLNMKNVKSNNNSDKRPVVFGGSYKDVKKVGQKSQLIVNGSVNNPFELDSIYAGNETGESSIPVLIELNQGVKVLNAIDASGKKGAVTEQVELNLGNVNVKEINNNHKTLHTQLKFNGFSATDGIKIGEYKDMKMNNSQITINDDKDFVKLTGTLELVGKSRLDISKKNNSFTVKDLKSEQTSIVVLNKQTGRLDITNSFEGNVELMTPGSFDSATSGTVLLKHTYLTAPSTSTGIVTFHPHFSQPNVISNKDTANNMHNWYFDNKIVNEPIDHLEVLGDKRVNIESEDEQSFVVKGTDKDGNPLDYVPIYNIQLKDPNGKVVDVNSVEIIHDLFSNSLIVYINDNTIVEGNYVASITDTVTNKSFDVPLVFHKNKQQISYQVKFHANKGTGNMMNQNFVSDTNQTLTNNAFTRLGYTFKGWSTTPDGVVQYKDGEVVNNLSNKDGDIVNLYAQWDANSYQIEFDANGGVGKMESLSMKYDVPSKLMNNRFTRSGYTFKGWSTTNNGEVVYSNEAEIINLTSQANGKVVLYAIWEKSMIDHQFGFKVDAVDQVIEVGEMFDPLNAITVFDENNKQVVLNQSNIIENTVNPNAAGVYHITYQLTDQKGITVTKTIQVTVHDKAIQPEIPNQPEKPGNSNHPNETLKPNNQVKEPNTGDLSNVGFMSTMLASSSGLIAILFNKRRKK